MSSNNRHNRVDILALSMKRDIIDNNMAEKIRRETGIAVRSIYNAVGCRTEQMKKLYDIEQVIMGLEPKYHKGEKYTQRIKDAKTINEVAEVMEVYDELMKKGLLPKYIKLSNPRRIAVNKRIKDHGLNTVVEGLRLASESDWLKDCVETQSFYTLDWIFKPSNFIKILEEKYSKSYENDGGVSNVTLSDMENHSPKVVRV